MRIPRVGTTNENNTMKEEVRNINFYITPSMYVQVNELLENDKKRTKFIKKIESLVRGSMEYREFISFLRDEIDMNSCLFYNNVDRNNMKVRIEIHHDPFTLYDITEIVLNKRINNQESLSPMLVAEEVMKLHYMGIVGLIPLSLTVHQLVHAGELFIPINTIYGNLKEFISQYKRYMTPEHISLLKKSVELTETMLNEEYNPAILERKAIYLNVRDQEKLTKKLTVESDIEKVV